MRLYNEMIKSQSGFTLIELMLAMVVCVLALLSIVGANTMIQQTTERGYEDSVVAQDINEVIEQIRDAANSAADENFQTDAVTAASTAVTSVKSLPSINNESLDVAYVDQSADPLDVTVTAAWDQQGLRGKTMSMRALITRRT